MRTRLVTLACLAFGLSLAVGCGDSSGTGGGGGAASGGASEGGSTGEGGSADVEVNGCTRATADDKTGLDEVTLTWTLTHQECILVDAGTKVIWDGDFVAHPLKGGVPPESEAGPITSSDQTGATAEVIFASGGEFPYFCGIHLSSMQGVVYVE